MPVRGLDHYHIDTRDLAGTIAFYRDVLGMTLGDRPAFDIPGAWMCANGQAVIHVNEVGDPKASETGPVDHVAFEAEDFESMCDRLRRLGVSYEVVDSRRKRPLRQIYLRDPNSVRIELGFRGA